MKSVCELLKLLHARFPTEEGRHHAVVLLEDGMLHVHVWMGAENYHFGLDEGDFDRPPVEVFNDIVALLSSQARAG